MFADGKEAEGVPGAALDDVEVEQEGTGGAAGTVGLLATHVDEERASGADGLEGGGRVDARRLAVIGAARGDGLAAGAAQ